MRSSVFSVLAIASQLLLFLSQCRAFGMLPRMSYPSTRRTGAISAAPTSLERCIVFRRPTDALARSVGLGVLVVNKRPMSALPRSARLGVLMAKKGKGGSSKRRQKKDNGPAGPATAGGGVVDTLVDVGKVADQPEVAGAGFAVGGAVREGSAPILPGGESEEGNEEILADGVVGSDARREAKITETLQRLGVKGVTPADSPDPGVKTTQGAGRKGVEEDSKDLTDSIFDAIPPDVQAAFEKFLIAGFSVSLLLFVGCGVAIGLEAFAISSKEGLDPALEKLVVENVEPLFTPTLGATFLFSSVLGVFKLGQMGRSSVTYKEDD